MGKSNMTDVVKEAVESVRYTMEREATGRMNGVDVNVQKVHDRDRCEWRIEVRVNRKSLPESVERDLDPQEAEEQFRELVHMYRLQEIY